MIRINQYRKVAELLKKAQDFEMTPEQESQAESAYDKNSKKVTILEAIHIPESTDDFYWWATVTLAGDNFGLARVNDDSHWDTIEADVDSVSFKKNFPKMVMKQLSSFMSLNAWGVTKEEAQKEAEKYIQQVNPDPSVANEEIELMYRQTKEH